MIKAFFSYILNLSILLYIVAFILGYLGMKHHTDGPVILALFFFFSGFLINLLETEESFRNGGIYK